MSNTYKREQVVEIINSVIQRVSSTQSVDNFLLKDIEQLKQTIDTMRSDLNGANPGKIQSHIPGAEDELDAIVKTTESATNEIMAACEAIQQEIEQNPLQETARIESEIIRIVEACTFQDITGQRIGKIIQSLKEIDQQATELSLVLRKRFSDLTEAPEPARKNEDSLLNGPQLPGQGISQEEIDNLLNI